MKTYKGQFSLPRHEMFTLNFILSRAYKERHKRFPKDNFKNYVNSASSDIALHRLHILNKIFSSFKNQHLLCPRLEQQLS
jgi:hypothetical protein